MQTSGDDDGDRLQLFTAAQLNSFSFQVHAFNLNIRPKIEIRSLRLLDKTIAQLAPVRRPQSKIILDRVVNRKKLPADFLALLEHERVETQLVAPTGSR